MEPDSAFGWAMYGGILVFALVCAVLVIYLDRKRIRELREMEADPPRRKGEPK